MIINNSDDGSLMKSLLGNINQRRVSSRIFKALYYLIPISFLIGFLLTWFFLPSITRTTTIKRPKDQPLSDNDVRSNEEHFIHNGYQLQHTNFSNDQLKVIEEMKHSWLAYRKYAWGNDHLKPISRTYHNWFGLGLTAIDSIDTLVLMGLKDYVDEIVDWSTKSLDFDKDVNVNCFETTIRVLGGLLSAYHLTGYPVFKEKALDIGDRLYYCYKSSSSKVPFSDVNLKHRSSKSPTWFIESSTSEVSTIQIEFRDLSRLVGDSKYEKTAFQTSILLHDLVKANDPLVPMFVNPNTEKFKRSRITFGARADSYYEYLMKQYIQTGIKWLEEDFIDAIHAMKNRLLKTTKGTYKLTYIAEITESGSISPKQDHLVCFLPGTLALGYYKFTQKYKNNLNIPTHRSRPLDAIYKEHLEIAEQLARTCYFTHNTTETGLPPEITYFELEETNPELFIHTNDRHNLLRPEYIESLFYLYHITKKEMYREQGRQILNSFIKYSRVENGGYTTISDVTNKDDVKPRDFQESFWTGETLKYLFLLFSDDSKLIETILNNFVINTEAHLINLYNDS